MPLTIRPGTREDIDALAALYDACNDHLAATVNWPGWRKGVYPVRADAADGVRGSCLFVAEDEKGLAGSIILRAQQEPAYLGAHWQEALPESALLVVHTFVVAPRCLRQGVGARLLAFAEAHARQEGVRALRLDVYEKNAPAMRLYEKAGYRYIEKVSLGLETCGLDWFCLYERLL